MQRTETITELRERAAKQRAVVEEQQLQATAPERELREIERELLKNEIILALEVGTQREITEAREKLSQLSPEDQAEIAERVQTLNEEEERRLYDYQGEASDAVMEACEFLKNSNVEELFQRQAQAYRAFIEAKKRMALRVGKTVDEMTAASSWKPIRAGSIDGVSGEALMFLACGVIAPSLDVRFDVARAWGYKPKKRG